MSYDNFVEDMDRIAERIVKAKSKSLTFIELRSPHPDLIKLLRAKLFDIQEFSDFAIIEFKDYRMSNLAINPVYINHDAVVVVHLFKNSTDIVKLIQTSDLIDITEDYAIYHEAAKRYIDALEGNESDHFLTALIDECKKRLNKQKI